MRKKNVPSTSSTAGQPAAAKTSESLPHTAALKILGEREATLLADERIADQREEKADRRQATADQRQENADLRQATADQRQENADLRQATADQRQENADLRQESADLRQVAADLRQEAADQTEQAARAKAELSAITEADLREANERLVVATVRAQTMTEAAERVTEQMSYMAQHDFLTGLPNRVLLNDRLAQAIALAERHGKRVALMYLDLDHFKHINDSLGHAIGDQLLQSAAQRLQDCLPRHSDTVSRQGGDEFVVLLAEVYAAQDAVATAEKLIKTMAEPHQIAGHRLHVTLSIGISLYPDDGKDAETVIRNADTAMYRAKKSGRNNYRMFTPDMNTHAVARRSVEDALHQALDEGGFVLHYQPKVNLESGAITGAEALVRLQQANQPVISPSEFINVAEKCGLIMPLGKWVLGEACRQAVAWLQAGLNFGQIAVNVSAAEFHGEGFLAGVRAILDETGLDPSRLEIEMTESGLMQDTVPTTEILRALKALGVQIAIDDFGTGYSSLSYLRRFPVDTLKIDQSFIHDIDGESTEGSLVSAIIAMGKSLKLRIIAEGIETPQQLAFLQSHQCTEGQGYYFNRPLPADDFAALLKPA
ncbi:putative bifunctional diguanylate cyclase/phosphodiesterase [Dechloromonas sp. A34]|uniref:putative bifunctional diguanylate cyclase/phosphodiesterase n=1 Tax=Dechloromonas sp. A34 TaxID=447588 RepID=UPI002248FCC5|nr:EAL domain-containing protein [Dechloromonas sp. A34]